MENSTPENPNNPEYRASLQPFSENNEQKIEIAQEELHVSKRIETEKLYFSKEVITEDVRIPVELMREDIEIEHIPKNIELTEIPKIQISDDLTIIPVFEEVAVIVKKIMLVEEIHIRKNKTSEVQVIQDSIRKEVFKKDQNQNTLY